MRGDRGMRQEGIDEGGGGGFKLSGVAGEFPWNQIATFTGSTSRPRLALFRARSSACLPQVAVCSERHNVAVPAPLLCHPCNES